MLPYMSLLPIEPHDSQIWRAPRSHTADSQGADRYGVVRMFLLACPVATQTCAVSRCHDPSRSHTTLTCSVLFKKTLSSSMYLGATSWYSFSVSFTQSSSAKRRGTCQTSKSPDGVPSTAPITRLQSRIAHLISTRYGLAGFHINRRCRDNVPPYTRIRLSQPVPRCQAPVRSARPFVGSRSTVPVQHLTRLPPEQAHRVSVATPRHVEGVDGLQLRCIAF
jgi:hypothetical protein